MNTRSTFAAVFITGCCWGQTPQLTDDFGSFLSEDLAVSPQLEVLDQQGLDQDLFSEDFKPIRLNQADAAEIRRIPWLSALQIQSLQNHIDRNGPLVSIYELQAVPGWDIATIRLVEPLITIPEIGATYDSRKFSEKFGKDQGLEFIFRTRRRLELSSGYLVSGKNSYLGGPLYWLYRISYSDKGAIRFGITAEKDPGERSRWNIKSRQFGSDYLSFYFQIENKGIIRRLLVGDFRAQWDQGLILGNSFSLGQQVISSPRKVHRGFTVHSGSRETGFFSGVATEMVLPWIEISSFYSRRLLDARVLVNDSAQIATRITSILETGLHRTITEIQRKKNVQQQAVGLHLRKNWSSHLSISLSALVENLSIPFIPDPKSYNKYWFSGRKNVNYSGSLEYVWKNLNIYSQFGISDSKGWGATLGIIGSLSHNTSISLNFRNYTKNFHGISGHAYGTQSRNINEQGIYWGIQVVPNHRWVLGTGLNIYRFPRLTFSADAPSSGLDHLFRVQRFMGKNQFVSFYWRGRTRTHNAKASGGKVTKDLITITKHSVGLRSKWTNKDDISVFTTIQYSRVQETGQSLNGLIVSNRVSYGTKFLKLSISGALFNTDDFDTRQYIYESNFPYSLSIPFYHGTGVRWYGMLRLKAARNLDLWFRLAQTRYLHTREIGSGSELIEGNKRTDLSFQARFIL